MNRSLRRTSRRAAKRAKRASVGQENRGLLGCIQRNGVAIVDVLIPVGLSPAECIYAFQAARIELCLACDSKSPMLAVHQLVGKGTPIFYPLCRTCHEDAIDPAQADAVEAVIRRRFQQYGEEI